MLNYSEQQVLRRSLKELLDKQKDGETESKEEEDVSTIQENDTENSGEDEDIWEEEKEKKKEAMAEWKGAGQLTT